MTPPHALLLVGLDDPLDAAWQQIVSLVVLSVPSHHTKRAYARALTDFRGWYEAAAQPGLSHATMQHYRAHLIERGLGGATINQRMAAIRKLVSEAAAGGYVSHEVATAIRAVKGVPLRGQRIGNWLSKEQAEQLLALPEPSLRHLRDRAILAVLLGCGLRRFEAAHLTLAQVQQREGRWVVVDLVGKHHRLRSVPMPAWAKATLDVWLTHAGVREGLLFRAIDRRGAAVGIGMTPQAIRDVVKRAGERIGQPELAPHDLRRTFAKLAHKGGAGLDQIQLSLGHASIQTTERYLGVDQDWQDAPCDHLGIRVTVG